MEINFVLHGRGRTFWYVLEFFFSIVVVGMEWIMLHQPLQYVADDEAANRQNCVSPPTRWQLCSLPVPVVSSGPRTYS